MYHTICTFIFVCNDVISILLNAQYGSIYMFGHGRKLRARHRGNKFRAEKKNSRSGTTF